MELGECKCVIPANQALSAEVGVSSYQYQLSCDCHVIDMQEVDEVYYLVFPSYFVILAVGQSLSGYEIKVSWKLRTTRCVTKLAGLHLN